MCKETQPPIDGWVSSFFMIVFMISLKKRLKKGVYNEHTRARYLASSGVWYGLAKGYSFASFMLALFFSIFTGLGISLGLHRHDTHQSFKAHSIILFALSVGAWMGVMRKATWISNHELHH